MDQPRSLDELEETIREGLSPRATSAAQRSEAHAALTELALRAQRVDASCEVCHAAAVAEGRAQERASA